MATKKTNTIETVMATMALNSEHNGVELTFNEKPSKEVRDSLKAVGYRWHSQRKLWYAKQNDKTVGLAEKLSGKGSSPKGKKAPAKATSPKGKKAEPKTQPKAETKAKTASPKVKADSKKSSEPKAPKAPAKKAQPKAVKAETKAEPEALKTIAYNGTKGAITAKLIKALNETEGLKAELDRDWLWVTGDTKPYRESLKGLGMHFSGKRQAWYLMA